VPKNVLLTGATGFVGGFIAEDLVEDGYKVFITARQSSDMSYLIHLPLQTVHLSLDDVDQLADFIHTNEINYIIHNAGLTRHPKETELNRVNATYIENLAKACLKSPFKVKKLVFVSSLAGYGPADHTPKQIIDYSTIPQPVTAYGRSKLLGEKLLKNYDVPYLILRPTAVYGPREKDLYTVFKMISKRLQITLGGQQILSFIYVKDLSQVIVKSLSSAMPRQEYFVTDGNKYSNFELNEVIRYNLNVKTLKLNLPLWVLKRISQVNEFISSLTGFFPVVNKDKYNELAARSWYCDSKDVWNDLKMSPKYDLRAGIKETVAWYRTNKWI
jgi:nucleoside-diphosphate-sugar epimerase